MCILEPEDLWNSILGSGYISGPFVKFISPHLLQQPVRLVYRPQIHPGDHVCQWLEILINEDQIEHLGADPYTHNLAWLNTCIPYKFFRSANHSFPEHIRVLFG